MENLEKVQLVYNGKKYDVHVENEEALARNLIEQHEIESDLLKEPNPDSDAIDYEQNQQTEVQWTRPATRLLITKHHEATPEFQNPKSKKCQIWNKIAQEMQQNGFHWCTGSACDRKWRNLIKTYRRIKGNNKRPTSGRERRDWEYFDQMDDLLRTKPFSHPRKQLLSSSLVIDVHSPDDSMSPPLTPSDRSTLHTSGKQSNVRKDSKRKRQSQESPAWFTEYIKDRKAVYQRREDAEKKKLEIEEKRWSEMKEMETAKIEAFNKLTETLQLIFK